MDVKDIAKKLVDNANGVYEYTKASFQSKGLNRKKHLASYSTYVQGVNREMYLMGAFLKGKGLHKEYKWGNN